MVPPAPGAPPAPTAPPASGASSALGWEQALFGPLALLTLLWTTILTGLFVEMLPCNIKCRWRVAYAPKSIAFSIWIIIYVWVLASCFYQLAGEYGADVRPAEAASNLLAASSFAFCSGWLAYVDSWPQHRDEHGVTVAALFIWAAAATAMAAVVHERAWRRWNEDPTYAWMVGGPLALFAGWLLVATALSTGTAFKALSDLSRRGAQTASSTSMTERAETRLAGGQRHPEQCQSAEPWERWVPLALAVLVAAAASLLPDPILPVPLAWGLLMQRTGTTPNRVAAAVLVAGSVVAFSLAASRAHAGP